VIEEFFDSLWFKTVDGVHHLKNLLDGIFAPLNALGPALAIFTIALITVFIAKFLTKTIKTKRYQELKKEFHYWYNMRQEALKCEDPDKAKLLVKNIDQAKLNKLYYDYFLEGFLISLVTKYLPIFCFLAYVNEAYQPDNMVMLFGNDYVFKFGNANAPPIIVGAVFWFIISILLVYLGWFILKKIYKKCLIPKKQPISSSP
jgi:uncharacterized membrane protein (DUF106 family)